jgi:predicted dehydrogenase
VNPRFEDMFAGTVRFADGTLGVLEINWLTPRKIRELFVTGERGMFCVDYITQDLRFCENAETTGDDWVALSLIRGVKEGPETKFAVDKKEPLRLELEAFISQVQGHTTSAANGRDGHAAMELATALVESAHIGEVRHLYPDAQHQNGKVETASVLPHLPGQNGVPAESHLSHD